ncbi:acetyltransferase [Gordonia hankookensis]|uniref:Acetyltransferase n=1 Tax=Gordonia hankookensis TaxID=589403 RepID=A0ABR7WAV1_9ACTN|nr:acetyltransferase [Gordonia hankookensis]MBD1319926.1 acetyltransferase [Gordonia hankookensis]
MIAATEYAIARFGCTVTLCATTESLDFTPAPGWYELDAESAHAAMASRVLLRSATPTPRFVPNVAVQYFDLGQTDVIDLAEIDTGFDIGALDSGRILTSDVRPDGNLSVDEGTYRADGEGLRVRRSQLAYLTPVGHSMLSIVTATTAVDDWDSTEFEIRDMEERWIRTTIPASGVR